MVVVQHDIKTIRCCKFCGYFLVHQDIKTSKGAEQKHKPVNGSLASFQAMAGCVSNSSSHDKLRGDHVKSERTISNINQDVFVGLEV